MEGLTEFDIPWRPLVEAGERPQHTSIERAKEWRNSARRTARPRLERKLAAIVAVDVVGYSRLTGRDEEGAVRRLCGTQTAISLIVEAHGGRTVNVAGDAMLLEFPSTVAALDCALAIQDLVGARNRGVLDDDKMLLRIGVNVGDVIASGGDVFGEVVNIASRLEAIAEPGGVCVSHACYMQTRRRLTVNFTDLGEHCLKNIAKPVRAYAVRPPSAPSPHEAVLSQAAPPGAGNLDGFPGSGIVKKRPSSPGRIAECAAVTGPSPGVRVDERRLPRRRSGKRTMSSEALDRRRENVSNAPLGPNELRHAWIGFELAAKAKDLHVNTAIEDVFMDSSSPAEDARG